MALRNFFKTIGLAKLSQKELKTDQEPLGEAFPYSVIDLSQDVEPIVLDYLNGEIGDPKGMSEKHQQFTLFYRNLHTLRVPYLAALAAEKMVWCDADGVEALVKENPSILKYVIPEVKPPCGGPLYKKTLLQIAGAMNEFDPREMKPKEKPYGIVSRLARYLPQEEVAAQLSIQFPSGWEAETKKRMDEYFTALTTFSEGLINMVVPQGSTLEAECKFIIETYSASLNSAANKEVIIGLICSPQIFVRAIEYYVENRDHFDGWYSDKSDLFWKIGYSALQQRAAGDAPIIKHGIYNLVSLGEIPNRSLTFSGASYYSRHVDSAGFLSLSSWGFFVDDGGRARTRYGAACELHWENLCRAKTAALQNLCSNQTVHRKAIR